MPCFCQIRMFPEVFSLSLWATRNHGHKHWSKLVVRILIYSRSKKLRTNWQQLPSNYQQIKTSKRPAKITCWDSQLSYHLKKMLMLQRGVAKQGIRLKHYIAVEQSVLERCATIIYKHGAFHVLVVGFRLRSSSRHRSRSRRSISSRSRSRSRSSSSSCRKRSRRSGRILSSSSL